MLLFNDSQTETNRKDDTGRVLPCNNHTSRMQTVSDVDLSTAAWHVDDDENFLRKTQTAHSHINAGGFLLSLDDDDDDNDDNALFEIQKEEDHYRPAIIDNRLYHYYSEITLWSQHNIRKKVTKTSDKKTSKPSGESILQCSSRLVEACIRGLLFGWAWGAIFATSTEITDQHLPTPQSTTQSAPLSKLYTKRGQALDSRTWTHQLSYRVILHETKSEAVQIVKFSRTYGAYFALFMGVFACGSCVGEKLRGKKDWINSGIGGLTAGSLLLAKSSNPRKELKITAFLGALAAFTSWVSSKEGRMERRSPYRTKVQRL